MWIPRERSRRTCRSCAAARSCWRACGCCARPGYGYGLLEELQTRGFDTDANTLYPLLRRLEKQRHLTSEWNTADARPRKFYRTSAAGTRLANVLTDEFRAIATAVDALPEKSRS